ncbi:MAG: WhiB family redox-sensing transcriptional regulator [Ilumatobacter sp.]|jgi:WhiB family redox-sensing transcriptional regulator
MNLTLTSTPTLMGSIEEIFDDTDLGSSFARCGDGCGTLSYLFFSEDDHELARAKAICRPCGLKDACLSGAIDREEPYGVWGGKLVLDGVPVEVKRKRGRPPTNPLPVLVVDEVPIPKHLVA